MQARERLGDKLIHQDLIRQWVLDDTARMRALQLAAELNLPDWCLAAGFVRNLVWDRLHNREEPTPLNDLDLVYYDSGDLDPQMDRQLELRLKALSQQPWSVKNQARMHLRNCDNPYTSTRDAMSYWVEIETAVGIRLSTVGELEIVAPFGLANLFEYTITFNRKRIKSDDFHARIEKKNWLSLWPGLKVSA